MDDADQRYRLDPARTSFLDLPLELRNQIYELALLSPCLPVVSRPSKLQLWGDYTSKWRAQPHLRSVMLKRPARERSAWLSNTVTCRHNASLQVAADIELGVDTVANVEVTPTQSSYELHKCANVSSSLLMANRQIYSKTANIFYGRNVFAFNTRWEDA
jgi:hypothetical protein